MTGRLFLLRFASSQPSLPPRFARPNRQASPESSQDRNADQTPEKRAPHGAWHHFIAVRRASERDQWLGAFHDDLIRLFGGNHGSEMIFDASENSPRADKSFLMPAVSFRRIGNGF
jgi:hypothetical protein